MPAPINLKPEVQEDFNFLFEIIHDHYGHDFKNYSRKFQQSRIELFLKKKNFYSIYEFADRIKADQTIWVEFFNFLSIPTTKCFRDPSFFISLRKHVIPYLQTYPNLKVWHPGCSTGEEVFSMAILFSEANVLKNALLYGTDFNPNSLRTAKKGILPSRVIARDTPKYFESLCPHSLHEYWTVNHELALFNQGIMKHLIFGEHNLVTDSGFGEMQLICCRNVLIYFNRELQGHVLSLFKDSLSDRGFLCLGLTESLLGTPVERDFEVVDSAAKIYRKKPPSQR